MSIMPFLDAVLNLLIRPQLFIWRALFDLLQWFFDLEREARNLPILRRRLVPCRFNLYELSHNGYPL